MLPHKADCKGNAAKFGANFATIGPNSVYLGQIWSFLLPRTWSVLVNLGPDSAASVENWQHSVDMCVTLAQIWPSLAKFGRFGRNLKQIRVNFGPTRVKVARTRPESAALRPILTRPGPAWPTFEYAQF